MPTVKERIVEALRDRPGLTDRELTDLVIGPGQAQQPVNQAARDLERRGYLSRRRRPDGLIGNFLAESAVASPPDSGQPVEGRDPLSENSIKSVLDKWLRERGWHPTIAWDRTRGPDIDARRANERWLIEAKGRGGSPQEQGNYFLGVLAELLQRMSDPGARYSVALPDLPRYRGLWERLPSLAKSRLQLSALFVDERGAVREET